MQSIRVESSKVHLSCLIAEFGVQTGSFSHLRTQEETEPTLNFFWQVQA